MLAFLYFHASVFYMFLLFSTKRCFAITSYRRLIYVSLFQREVLDLRQRLL
jgi:hypothetical protein